jgi:ParB family transcriptional regulator, chromosome partitioning protein
MAKNQKIALTDIVVPSNRMRQLRPELIYQLMPSIRYRGLLQPIIVRPRPKGAGFFLVAGRHRLEAVRKLKHKTIECRVLEGISLDEARLAEIQENLERGDLTPAERAIHHAEGKRLYEKLHPTTKAGVAQGLGMVRSAIKKAGGQVGPEVEEHFTEALAKVKGRSRRTIKRDVARGENLDPEALADATNTCLDKATNWTLWRSCRRPSNASWRQGGREGQRQDARETGQACRA